MADSMNLAVPLKLDAFVLNEEVCGKDEKDAKIAPITQPNYTFLQLDDSLIQNDILDHIDLHNAFPAQANPRLYDLGTGKPHENRMGVYLHWIMPRFYRTGTAATPSAHPQHTEELKAKGLGKTHAEKPEDYASPAFRALPNRWLVIRKLDTSSIEPKTAKIDEVAAWVVESDRVRSIDDEDLVDADLQVDISPYITTNKESALGGINLAKQAEVFIGYKKEANDWEEWNERTTPSKPKPERVDLTAISSSNQLFLDYQPHCSNVFSTVDTFKCTVNDSPSQLTSAKADYYVLGWHSDATKGPFGDLTTGSKLDRRKRLESLEMELQGSNWPKEITDWLDSDSPGQSLCHGAMYSVIWNRTKKPDNMPAQGASTHLLDNMPVTVGTTPIDSLLAYVDSFQYEDHETDPQRRIEKDIHMLGPLLRAQDEGVDAHRVAMDEVQNWNFSRESGGSHWYIQSQPGQKVQTPSDDDIKLLEQLNNAQKVVDTISRQIIEMRWTMFSYWWRYFSATTGNKKRWDIDYLKEQIEHLQTIAGDQKHYIAKVLMPKFTQKPQEGVLPEFSQPRDPTLLVAGIQAGWPDDYLEKLKVRLDDQFVKLDDDSKKKLNIEAYCLKVLPEQLRGTAQKLIQEFVKLSDKSFKPKAPEFSPLYHDKGLHGEDSDPLRDDWNETQPWAPLFLEWGAEYFHIPWEDWGMIKEQKAKLDPQWRLGISDKDLLNPPITDSRPLSGRILLLPQPNFSLQAAIDQLFSSVDPDTLKKYIKDEDDRKEIQKNTWKLPFLSAPLSGFNDHLRTVVQGTHIKPLVRYPRNAGYGVEGLHPISEAASGIFKDKEDHLRIIDIYSEVTPYGAYLTNSTSILNPGGTGDQKKPCAFKPVSHGQFRFSKLNIVDKFGTVINSIDARYGHEDEQAVYPHLSSYYEPQLLNDKPNLVQPHGTDSKGHVEFAQVPPSINQAARLNSTFVKYDKRRNNPVIKDQYSYWHPVTEWENPIWGWIVLNYVDYGIQLFLPDGTFYREVRLSSPNAPKHIAASSKWLPFGPPTERQDTVQLDHLIELLSNKNSDDYLHAFLNMVNNSLESTSSTAPSAYAGFLNSLVGRPLALVNAGWSLELSIDARINQADHDSHHQDNPPVHLIRTLPEQEIYEFPVKLGDEDRASDGLVGLFHLKPTEKNVDPTPGDELDLTTIYTYYKGTDTSSTLQSITPQNLPSLPSFWLDPGSKHPDVEKHPQEFARKWNNQLKVFGALVDPFLPITAFSSILPMNNLRLPEWTWQEAMQKMTAFFHLGPMIVTEDVEKYRKVGTALKDSDYRLDDAEHDPTIKDSTVAMPSLPTGDWAWLQPFVDDNGTTQYYKALGLGKVDSRPKFEPSPYTAVEGYLQLKQPIIRPEVTEKSK